MNWRIRLLPSRDSIDDIPRMLVFSNSEVVHAQARRRGRPGDIQLNGLLHDASQLATEHHLTLSFALERANSQSGKPCKVSEIFPIFRPDNVLTAHVQDSLKI